MQIEESLIQPWAGIFNLEKKLMMNFTAETIKVVLKNPAAETQGVSNRYLIFRMLQALNWEQSRRKVFIPSDVKFLTSVAEGSKRYNNLTPRQAGAVGLLLLKYSKVLVEVAKAEAEKHAVYNAQLRAQMAEDDDNILSI